MIFTLIKMKAYIHNYILIPCFGLISTDLSWVLCTTKTLPYINKFLNKITGKISGAPLSCIQIRNWFLLRHYLFLLFKHRVSVVIYISMNIGVVLHLDFFVKVPLILHSIVCTISCEIMSSVSWHVDLS